MKTQHFATTKFSKFVMAIFAGTIVLSAPFTFAGLVYQVDVTGSFTNVPFGTTAYGQSINSGTTYDFTFYLDYDVAVANRNLLASGSIYFDPTHGTTIAFNGGTAISIPGISKLRNENVGGPNFITLTQDLPGGAIANPFFGTGSARADFRYLNGPSGSIDSAISALRNFSEQGPPHSGAFGGSFNLLSTLNGQPEDLAGTVDNVVVAVVPVPEPTFLNLGALSVVSLILLRKRCPN